MKDVEDEVTRYLNLAASSVQIRPDLEAVKSGRSIRAESPEPSDSASGRRFLAAAVTVLLVAAAAGWALRPAETSTVAMDTTTIHSTTIPLEADPTTQVETTPQPPVPEDPTRLLLAEQASTNESRYLRIWNHSATDSDADLEILLSEQWFTPAGDAIGATALIEPPLGDQTWLDPNQTLRLSELQVILENSQERALGYPERELPTTVEAMAVMLADDTGLAPGVFFSFSTVGTDSSYLPSQATTSVTNLTRLLPTIMEPEARRLAFGVASTLEEAETGAGIDLLDRAATTVVVPLAITDPTTGVDLGQLNVTFWFDPASYAILQIEWRLVSGTLGTSDTAEFVNTTVVVAAGAIATTPEVTRPPTTDSAPTTPPSTDSD